MQPYTLLGKNGAMVEYAALMKTNARQMAKIEKMFLHFLFEGSEKTPLSLAVLSSSLWLSFSVGSDKFSRGIAGDGRAAAIPWRVSMCSSTFTSVQQCRRSACHKFETRVQMTSYYQ